VLNLKRKVDAGAEYVTSQMFFENQSFITFVERCREVGITVPIIPGLKILTSKRQLRSLPARFNVHVPEALATEIESVTDEQVAEIGIAWALKQCEGLVDAGFPNLHFYIIQTPAHVSQVVRSLRKMA
jgi:methylenetetrahydrofolate reductase (NADPH)